MLIDFQHTVSKISLFTLVSASLCNGRFVSGDFQLVVFWLYKKLSGTSVISLLNCPPAATTVCHYLQKKFIILFQICEVLVESECDHLMWICVLM